MCRNLRIAVADDDAGMRELVQHWLGQLGHEVTAVDGGWPLVKLCRADRPDLVVSDVRMPDLDGLAAAETIRRVCGPVPTVLMSGRWEPDRERRADAVGAVRLDKPFLPLELVTAVDAACGVRTSRRVLVVGGDPDTADSLALLIELLGCRVQTARDGVAAEATAAILRPDVAVVDVGASPACGLDAVRRLRRWDSGRAVRIVAHTGWTQDDVRTRAREAGCDDYLVKPVATDVLRQTLCDSEIERPCPRR